MATVDCWNQIGVWGDRSCPKLKAYIHCRNCPVYAAAGRSLLEREAPEGYLSEWTELLTEEKEASCKDTMSVVIFRLGTEWLALAAQLFQEVTQISVIRTLPHRSNQIFTGLVNIRGEIQICISLSHLLGLETEADSPQNVSHPVYRRMVVVETEGNHWVFPVDEIYGIHHFYPDELQNVPATISKARDTYSKGIIPWQEKNISYLDDELLFYTVKRRVL
ncbi:MAG: chemotaxis protein CheW [Chamaesiphon sp.]